MRAMMKKWLMTLLLGLFLAATPVLAGGLSLDQAVKKVQRDTRGRVLSASTVHRGGRAIHRVRVLLPDGRVRTIEVKGK